LDGSDRSQIERGPIELLLSVSSREVAKVDARGKRFIQWIQAAVNTKRKGNAERSNVHERRRNDPKASAKGWDGKVTTGKQTGRYEREVAAERRERKEMDNYLVGLYDV
jgi:hypothetical protein